MNEDKSKLKLIGEIAQANNKNLDLIQEINELQDKLEAYENMRKEAIDFIKDMLFQYEGGFTDLEHVLHILNKVGGSDE